MKQIQIADHKADDVLKEGRENLKGQLELRLKRLEVEKQKRKNADKDTDSIDHQIEVLRQRLTNVSESMK